MNRERLFARLGQTPYSTLIDATALGRSRRHAFVDLDHWALSLLRHSTSDLALLLSALGCNLAVVQHRIENSLSRVRESGDSLRDLSPVLERSVAPAITWSQIVAPSTKVRSGHLVLAWLDDDATRRWFQQLDSVVLAGISVDQIIECYESLAAQWPEAKETEVSRVTSITAPTKDSSALENWATCLNDQVKRGELDPVVGRDDELRSVIDILLRRRQNNPILVGEAGVGKTAVVEALAQRIEAGLVPVGLSQAKVWALDITRLQAGASARGEFEQRLRSVMEAVLASPEPIILFCDEAHTLIGAGGSAGTGDAVNLIKPMLARGQLRMVAATTWSEYKQFIEPDAALTRRFQSVAIEQPDDPRALSMLRVIAPKFAKHHGVHISDTALAAAVKLSRRHLPGRQLPDKAISLLDTACARVAMSQSTAPSELERLGHKILTVEQALQWRTNDRRMGLSVPEDDDLQQQRLDLNQQVVAVEVAVEKQRLQVTQWLDDFSNANNSGDEQEFIDLAPFTADNSMQWVKPWVDEQAIAEVLSDWTGVPSIQLDNDDAQRIVALESELQARIYGQPHALQVIAKNLQVSRAGLSEPHRPLGVLMLAGPTGTGKSQTATALSELLFGGAANLIQFNMNEFHEAHTVSTLKGAPPGYVGYGKGGRMTEAVRQRPYSVLLLDEFDRAHSDIHEIFYQAFDQGWMEDGEGRRISFRNCLILLTSNLGDAEIEAACLANPEISQGRLEMLTRERLQSRFAPALLARMQIVPFRPLDIPALSHIALQALAELSQRLADNGTTLQVDENVAEWIANAVAKHPASGRAIRDLLRQQVVPVIAQAVLNARAVGDGLPRVRVSAEQTLFLSFGEADSIDRVDQATEALCA